MKNVLTDVANVLPGSHVLSPDLIMPVLLAVGFFSVSEHSEGALLSSSPDLPLSKQVGSGCPNTAFTIVTPILS